MPDKSPFGGYEIPPEDQELTDEQRDLLYRISKKIVDGGWTVPAILTLESVKPLNYIGSQVMVFAEPFAQAVFKSVKDYNAFRQMLEKRDNIERFLQKIEELDAVKSQEEKEQKKKYKAEKKKKRAKRKLFWRKLFGREDASDTNTTTNNDDSKKSE